MALNAGPDSNDGRRRPSHPTPLALGLVVLLTGPAASAEAATLLQTSDGRTAIDLVRTDVPPVIDGSLDDEAWRTPALDLPDWITYNPVRGQTMAQKTEVRLTYDEAGLYLAFRCMDPEPGKVRANLSRHDQLWNDDWIGLSLDATGQRQQSYDLFVNPLGVQGDILNTTTAGEDSSPDWVWQSAGRLTPQGYDVELRVPWKSIRFASGEDVRMSILFWRRVSRAGTSASWPPLPADKPFFQNHAPLLLHHLERPLALEVVPSTTFARNEERESPTAFGAPQNDPDLGMSVKYGITSTTSVEATLNPDFSQVESDAFQMQVNQRYPVFYSEKRPFFMEGMGTFQLASTGGDANMRTAVHTRRIVDPDWGAKTSGSLGRVTFAGLVASDSAPGHAPDAAALLLGRNATFVIGRATMSLGPSSYLGAIGTDTELANGHNRVAGTDVSLSRGPHLVTATFLASQTRSHDGTTRRHGLAGQAYYGYETKRWTFVSQTEHYDRDFQMDTAFVNQTGITGNWSYGRLSLYPDQQRQTWFKRFNVFIFGRVGRDRIQGGDPRFGLVGFQASFTRQGSLRVDTAWGREPWAQHEFATRFARAMGGAQILRWLNVDFYLQRGRSVYYDEKAPFAGPSWDHSLTLVFQPSAGFRQSVSWDRSRMDRPATGERAFGVDLLNLRTSYQFDRRFALRAILRYASDKKRILTDALASFEPVPGTVVYAGYGSLIERRGWDGTGWVAGEGDYLTSRRGLFFKASYAHRF